MVNSMKYSIILTSLFALSLSLYVSRVNATEERNQVCTDVGELVHGDQKKCKKGDLITLNSMLAAYLCDLSKSHIEGDKIIICHYLGYKRETRK